VISADMLANEASYESDFHAWALRQVALLREGRLDALDVENLAEEIGDLGSSQRSELVSRLAVLLTHLLKWQFQPERRGHSWSQTISEQRYRIGLLKRRSPSLRAFQERALRDAYRIALRRAAHESNLPEHALPGECAYTLDQVLDRDFWPGPV
jgi:hypothetical protein